MIRIRAKASALRAWKSATASPPGISSGYQGTTASWRSSAALAPGKHSDVNRTETLGTPDGNVPQLGRHNLRRLHVAQQGTGYNPRNAFALEPFGSAFRRHPPLGMESGRPPATINACRLASCTVPHYVFGVKRINNGQRILCTLRPAPKDAGLVGVAGVIPMFCR